MKDKVVVGHDQKFRFWLVSKTVVRHRVYSFTARIALPSALPSGLLWGQSDSRYLFAVCTASLFGSPVSSDKILGDERRSMMDPVLPKTGN